MPHPASPRERLRAAAVVVRQHTQAAHPVPDTLWCPQVAEALATWLETEADLLDNMAAMIETIRTSLQVAGGDSLGHDWDDGPELEVPDLECSPPSPRALELADQILAAAQSPAPVSWERRWGLREADGYVSERPHEGAPRFTEETVRAWGAQRLDSPEVVTRLELNWEPADR